MSPALSQSALVCETRRHVPRQFCPIYEPAHCRMKPVDPMNQKPAGYVHHVGLREEGPDRSECGADPVPLSSKGECGPVVLIGGMVMDVQVSLICIACVTLFFTSSSLLTLDHNLLQASPSANLDIQLGGSVPGTVEQTPGGVARNVAQTLAGLCMKALSFQLPLPLLVSAVGQDLAGDALVAHWTSMG
jgi:hypothetical protein